MQYNELYSVDICSGSALSVLYLSLGSEREKQSRVKSGKFGHQVNSDTLLQTVEIQMRRLLMSRLIRVFIVCLVGLFLFQ